MKEDVNVIDMETEGIKNESEENLGWIYFILGILSIIFLGYLNLVSLIGTFFSIIAIRFGFGFLGEEYFIIETASYAIFYWPNMVFFNWLLPIFFYIIGILVSGAGLLSIFGFKNQADWIVSSIGKIFDSDSK